MVEGYCLLIIEKFIVLIIVFKGLYLVTSFIENKYHLNLFYQIWYKVIETRIYEK